MDPKLKIRFRVALALKGDTMASFSRSIPVTQAVTNKVMTYGPGISKRCFALIVAYTERAIAEAGIKFLKEAI